MVCHGYVVDELVDGRNLRRVLLVAGDAHEPVVDFKGKYGRRNVPQILLDHVANGEHILVIDIGTRPLGEQAGQLLAALDGAPGSESPPAAIAFPRSNVSHPNVLPSSQPSSKHRTPTTDGQHAGCGSDEPL